MNSGPTLSIGSTGPDVRRLQVLLVMMEYLQYSDIDGNFGPKTQLSGLKLFRRPVLSRTSGERADEPRAKSPKAFLRSHPGPIRPTMHRYRGVALIRRTTKTC